MKLLRAWVSSGSPWVWLTAGAVSVCLVMVLALLLLVAVRGLEQFWPSDLLQMQYTEPDGEATKLIGEIVDEEQVASARVREMGYEFPADKPYAIRYLLKIGNREVYGMDFRWIVQAGMGPVEYPANIIAIEREEWGNFYGYLMALKENGQTLATERPLWDELQSRVRRKDELRDQIRHIQKDLVGGINFQLERLRLKERALELDRPIDAKARLGIAEERAAQQADYDRLNVQSGKLYSDINRDGLRVRIANGEERDLPLAKVIRVYRPNDMGVFEKLGLYFGRLQEFIADDPREANTEGGIFPAIFGTVLMVLLMSVFVTPFGVLAAVYLREYAKQGILTRIIRIAVNNLAGVPSVVFGVFGLGFFIYLVGAKIDQLLFQEALPTPTFGTPGLLWSALTLALLTVPVVIVATEEGLTRVPRAIREGSLALGATKAETLWRTVLPMATPAIMTGLILAIARAAGEVAPLMMVGVVKLAPSLPLDGNFPFLHMDRKFMHLGFHIYDVGFQSPNVEAARPLVYATTLLLVLIIVALNLAAIRIRNRLSERYSAPEN